MLFSHRPAQASQASQIAQTTPSSSQSLEQEDESTESSSPSLLHRLDLRVGRIVSVKRHEGADTLYIQEDHPPAPKATRTIVSGLVPYVSASELSDSSVVLVRNLKPAKLRGVFSQGMLLCAEREGQVTPLRPPVGSLPGDRIWAQGHDLGDPDPVIRPKLKIVEQVCRDLRTNEDSVPTYRGEVLRTSSGPLYTSLPNASIR
ncbi:MAG: hypothetical protein DHS80DRAFT_14014 [Piptocephalis tieghemiana]|nr:MAG: hypothetical protein DHS80DRAFT_14014 [Piptocephalis tieghemiana]